MIWLNLERDFEVQGGVGEAKNCPWPSRENIPRDGGCFEMMQVDLDDL